MNCCIICNNKINTNEQLCDECYYINSDKCDKCNNYEFKNNLNEWICYCYTRCLLCNINYVKLNNICFECENIKECICCNIIINDDDDDNQNDDDDDKCKLCDKFYKN